MLQIQKIDDLPPEELKEQFQAARKPDYAAFIREVQSLKPSEQGFSTQMTRVKRRFNEIVEIDYFDCPLRKKAEEAVFKAEHLASGRVKTARGKVSKIEYQGRKWITRPRPGIDRVSSAWLIMRFIDPKAAFLFGSDPTAHPDAVPFDTYQSIGFGHEGDHCTFETLCARFGVANRKVLVIGQAIHDADLEDEKFGRSEGITINRILMGWAKQGIPDEELLRRGMDLIEGLYHSIA